MRSCKVDVAPVLRSRERSFARHALRALLRRSVLCVVLACIGSTAHAAEDESIVRVDTERLSLTWSTRGARLISVEPRARSAIAGTAASLPRFDPGEGPLSVTLIGVTPGGPLSQLTYVVERVEKAQSIELRFTAACGASGCKLEQVYEVPRRGWEIRWSARGFSALDPSTSPALVLSGGPAFRADPWSGWGAASERVTPVRIDRDCDAGSAGDVPAARAARDAWDARNAWDAQNRSEPQPTGAATSEFHCVAEARASSEWRGVRSRYWALLLASSSGDLRYDVSGSALRFAWGRDPVTLRIFTGPIAADPLSASDASLAALRFTSLWSPVRALAQLFDRGLTWMVDWLHGGVGWAILLLSIFIKLGFLPLTRLAERLQRDVEVQRARLQPALDVIRASSRGEERSRRILELYAGHGVSPFHGLKSLLGVAIQLPIFFAMYHVLDEHVALAGRSFLWIEDLARPDVVAVVPIGGLAAGAPVHALPILMTLLACLAARLHHEPELGERERIRRRRGLYAMAGGFMVLFYTFPAGMVLYWTMNNLMSLARIGMRALSHRARARAGDRRCAPSLHERRAIELASKNAATR